MGVAISVVDSFTRRPFSGNPAAVCLLEDPPEEAWMQAVAAEMNLSETSFLWPEDDAWRLRWFTPVQEVDLCGHATLAAAHRLWETGLLGKSEAARFVTRSGLLTCDPGPPIRMDFPAAPAEPAPAPPGLFSALGIPGRPVQEDPGQNLLIVLDDEAQLRQVRPDFARLTGSCEGKGVIITAASGPHAYLCRYFAPTFGIDEDPATGSIQCTLGPFWAERLGTMKMHAHQLSPREGHMEVEVGDGRVAVSGDAVTVWEGKLRVDPSGHPSR